MKKFTFVLNIIAAAICFGMAFSGFAGYNVDRIVGAVLGLIAAGLFFFAAYAIFQSDKSHDIKIEKPNRTITK